MNAQNIPNNEMLNRIVRYLIINASFSNSTGLFHGKMGIAIFFFHYARYVQRSIYEEFAEELLRDIYKEVNTDMPVSLEKGLCGIAWGIEYLIQQGFVEGDSAEVLKDTDLHVMERDPKRISDLSFRNGLAGVGYYVACHAGSLELNRTALDSCYIEDLSAAMKKSIFKEEDGVPASVLSFYANRSGSEKKRIAVSLPYILFEEMLVVNEDSDWRTLPMGIEKGLAGLGLKLMNV